MLDFLDELSDGQLYVLMDVLKSFSADELRGYALAELTRREAEYKRIFAGTSRKRIVNRVDRLRAKLRDTDDSLMHGNDYYDPIGYRMVHSSYNRGIRYVHDGLFIDCLECDPNAW